MDISFSYFCQAVLSNPVMLVTRSADLGSYFCKWLDPMHQTL